MKDSDCYFVVLTSKRPSSQHILIFQEGSKRLPFNFDDIQRQVVFHSLYQNTQLQLVIFLSAVMCCERDLSVGAGIQSLTRNLLFGITARPWILDVANEER